MTLESDKNLGGVGALLIVLSPIAMAGTGILAIVGLILLLISLKGMARHFKERRIIDNALYGVVLAVVGVVISLVVIMVTAIAALSRYGVDFLRPMDWVRMGQIFSRMANFGEMWSLFGGIAAAIVVLFVFLIVAVIYFRRTLVTLAAKTDVQLFSTAGLIMLVGAVLTIVVIGLLLVWISFILLTVAFFSIKAK
ncbi:MAG: hypothetical protein APZ16_05585 [Candidatus Hadarchaeum yellowstonense]|uniref:DUF996 domain-containing protein n=1 Tax=Hadarchaeum yellowstonense TaxID=1776334 RepID=A0A147JU96_HADYE|nr:MAG: hypothetical protein APZ16_05585 [Candidatus Hadarchaeum yellowstonense]